MIENEILEKLHSLQAEYNGDRGISSVRVLIQTLKQPYTQEQLEAAIFWDWDKISSYPKVARYIKENIFDHKNMYVRGE